MYQNIICEKKGNVYIIKINRPSQLNSLNEDTLDELDNAIDDFSRDIDSYVCVLTGEGRAFVVGADVKYMAGMTIDEAKQFSKKGMDLFRKIELIEKPFIAAINGIALGGGCELAMSCDIIIASKKAKFGQPEVKLGIIPGFAGTQRLSRIVGVNKSKELILTGKIISANEAQDIRLINTVVEHDELLDEAMKMADSIGKNAQIAVRYAKNAINKGIEISIERGMDIENYLFAMCFDSQDQKEGMKCFLEKREPAFICG